MYKKDQRTGATANETGIEQAQTRSELAKTRREQTKTRSELVKTRREQARTRTELAKTRREQTKTRAELVKTREGEIRTKQVEKTLQRVVHHEFDLHDLHQKNSTAAGKDLTSNEFADQKNALKRLTGRQREILQLIAQSHNTKQIAGLLKVSSKTVEYHRRKLMAALNLHDVPGLVRLAVYTGLVSSQS